MRAGYLARDSRYAQHHMFADWVELHRSRFEFLHDGERVCGEWLAQAHGTRYRLTGDPFVAFDLMRLGPDRLLYDEFVSRIGDRLSVPYLIATEPTTPERAVELLGPFGRHGALDPVEGAVWRVEREGEVEFLAKWVRRDKVDGSYLDPVTGDATYWNWRP
jgi:hypothetical protein